MRIVDAVPQIHCLDHIAICVRDSDEALKFYRDVLKLEVVWQEDRADTFVRLTYLNLGNAFLQLVEPLDEGTELAQWLDRRGEGLHHIAVGVENLGESIGALSEVGSTMRVGGGRGYRTAFVSTPNSHGVLIECVEMRRQTTESR